MDPTQSPQATETTGEGLAPANLSASGAAAAAPATTQAPTMSLRERVDFTGALSALRRTTLMTQPILPPGQPTRTRLIGIEALRGSPMPPSLTGRKPANASLARCDADFRHQRTQLPTQGRRGRIRGQAKK